MERDEDGYPMRSLTKAEIEQLWQIADKSPHPGVWAGDLIDKTSTRSLIKHGLVQNSGGSPSSLSYVSLSARGTEIVSAARALKNTTR